MWVGVADKLWGLDIWMWGLWWDLNIDVEACVLANVLTWGVFGWMCGRVCSDACVDECVPVGVCRWECGIVGGRVLEVLVWQV